MKKTVPIPIYISHLKQEGKKASTIYQYEKLLLKLQKIHSFPITCLSYGEIIRFLESIGGRGIWRNTATIILKEFYKWLVNQGYRKDNPLEFLKVQHQRTREYPVFTSQEFIRILNASKPKVRDLLLHLRWTGLRISEALNSRKSDFMLDRVDNYGNAAPEMLVRGKGGTNIYIPLLNPTHVSWLKKRLFSKQSQERLFPMSYQQAWYGIHKAADRAGVQRMLYNEYDQPRFYITPHSIRRFFATWALQKGFDITMVQKLLRHKDINTTLRYAKVSNDMIRDRLQKLMVNNG